MIQWIYVTWLRLCLQWRRGGNDVDFVKQAGRLMKHGTNKKKTLIQIKQYTVRYIFSPSIQIPPSSRCGYASAQHSSFWFISHDIRYKVQGCCTLRKFLFTLNVVLIWKPVLLSPLFWRVEHQRRPRDREPEGHPSHKPRNREKISISMAYRYI